MERKKQLFTTTLSVLALAAVAAIAPAVARADISESEFSYQRLAGNFTAATATTGNLNVSNQNGIFALATIGDVSRLVAPVGNASFDFSSGSIGSANVLLALAVTGVTNTAASSTGTLILRDIDGDTLQANVSGNWVNVAGSGNFNGSLSNVVFSSAGTFNGTSGSFSSNFSDPQPFSGNVISLVFQGWFNNGGGGNAASFTNKTSQVDGQIVGVAVPQPASMVLGLIGLAPLAWRRRVTA